MLKTSQTEEDRVSEKRAESVSLEVLPSSGELSEVVVSSRSVTVEHRAMYEGPYRVLLVDDDRDVMEPWGRYLRRKGWEVHVAQSAMEALEWLDEAWCDVVVSDLLMPEVDGLSLLQKIRARDSEQAVVILTGYSTEERAIEAVKWGASGYLLKTSTMSDLSLTLDRVAEQSRLRVQNKRLAQELHTRNRQLEYQNRVISELYDVSIVPNTDTEGFLNTLCQRLRKILGVEALRISVFSSGLRLSAAAGYKALEWGANEPEMQVQQKQRVVTMEAEEVARHYPELMMRDVTFWGQPIRDSHQQFLGVLGMYFLNPETLQGLEKDLLALIAQKVGYMLGARLAEAELRESFQQHIEIAQFNEQLLLDFRMEEPRELELFRRTLDRMLSRRAGDRLPPYALVLREEGTRLRVTVFGRDAMQRVVVMAPLIPGPELSILFPARSGGVIFNQIGLPSDLHLSQLPPPPQELLRILGGHIANFVCCPLHAMTGSIGRLVLFNYGRPVQRTDAAILMSYSVTLGFQISIVREFLDRQRTQLVAMSKLAQLAEKRDDETGAHLRRISHYSRVLAEDLAAPYSPYQKQVDDLFIREIFDSSPLHDIGKVGIEDHILLKGGRLSEEEYEIMKTHTTIGAEVLEGVDFLKMAQLIALCHHERFDGKGYPQGLRGDDIPLAARIVTVADVYDAVTSVRVYRPRAFTHEEAKGMLLREYAKHFDPVVVDAFLRCEQLFVDLKERHGHVPTSAT
ncbi:response regulator [Myxococcota bacterium]|nr:response regulator [Myxococcota bacterium]